MSDSSPTQALEVHLHPKSSNSDTLPVYRTSPYTKHLQIQGTAKHPQHYKALRNASGTALYKFISYPDRLHIVSAESGRRTYTVRKKELNRSTGYGVVHVWKGENTSTLPWIEIKGDVLNRRYIVAEALPRRVLGYVKREKGVKDRFGVYVQAGVDTALLTAVVLGIDRHCQV